MTAECRAQILSKIGEYGTGADTLRCLALATIDEPVAKGDMDLQVNLYIQFRFLNKDDFRIKVINHGLRIRPNFLNMNRERLLLVLLVCLIHLGLKSAVPLQSVRKLAFV